jgi:hypothetical protein
MKMGPEAPGTAKNEFGRAKQENMTRLLGTAENESWRAKHENGTRSPQNRRKRVRASKTKIRDPTPRYRRK